jgi:hypothetical protein
MIDGPATPTEPRRLLWAREMQALAQTGLAFTHDPIVSVASSFVLWRCTRSASKIRWIVRGAVDIVVALPVAQSFRHVGLADGPP